MFLFEKRGERELIDDIDKIENEILTYSDPCFTCNVPDEAIHPNQLNIDQIRKLIPHTKGEHEPSSKGVYLCNGHCRWVLHGCWQSGLICLNCGYVECTSCAEDFFNELEEKVLPHTEGYGIANYCRNCGVHRSQVDLEPHKQYWIIDQILGQDDI